MQQLDFGCNSIREWQNFKIFYRKNFWQHLESMKMEINKIAIQEFINEEFELQIGRSITMNTPIPVKK